MSPPPVTSALESRGLFATLRHRDFTRLWVGQVVSSTGDRFYQFALLHIAMGGAGNLMGAFGRDAARVIFCGMILPVVLSRWIGHFVDRFDRKKIIFWTEAGRGAIAIGMLAAWLVGLSLGYLLVLVALSGLLTGLFIPARQAALPMLVPKEHLVRGNALMTFAGIAADLVGASAGLAITLIGESTSFAVAAAGFAFSAVMVYRIQTVLLPPAHIAAPLEAPIRTAEKRQAVSLLVWLSVAFTFVTGLFLPFFGDHVAVNVDCRWLTGWLSRAQDATFAGLIILLATTGAGLFLALLTAGQMPRFAHRKILPFSMLAIWGAAIWRLGNTTAFFPAAMLCLVAGWSTGLITIPSDARLQHEVPGARHGRIFSRRLALSNIAFLVGLGLNLDGRLLRNFGSEALLVRLGLLAILLAGGFWFAGGKSLLGSWGTEGLENENSVPASLP